MSMLTKSERDGLDDIFLSIHTGSHRYGNIGKIRHYLISNDISIYLSKSLKMAKMGLNESKISQFVAIFSKKKKFLSK